MIKIATFTVPGQPRPKERPRFGRGRGYTQKPLEQQKLEWLRRSGKQLGIRHTIESPVTGPLKVRLRFFRDNMRRVDLDNYPKYHWTHKRTRMG